MLRSFGLRVSLFGVLLFALGVLSLFFLPNAVSIVAILAGGLCVWGGFVRTIFSYYGASPPPPHDS